MSGMLDLYKILRQSRLNEEELTERKIKARELQTGDRFKTEENGTGFWVESINKAGIEASDGSELYIRVKHGGKKGMITIHPDDEVILCEVVR